MTDDRSLERAARSWLEEGPTRAPDRPVNAALARIQTTRQLRGLAIPWRFPTMFSNRIAVAALAIVLIVAGGGFALTRLDGVGVGGSSPTPIPRPAETPILSPSSPPPLTLTTADVDATLPAGTYRVEGFAVPFTVTLPAAWTANEFTRNSIALAKRSDGSVNVYLAVIDKVYRDPCHTESGPSAIEPGVDALVAAFSSMPGFEVTDVTEARFAGANGTSFQFTNSIDVAAANCSGDMLPLGTYERAGDDIDVSIFGGESDRFWVLDVAGTRVLVAVTDTPSIVHSTQPVLESISFGDAPSD